MSKIGTAFKLLIAPKKALAFCREKMVKGRKESIPLVAHRFEINKLYPVHSAKSILIVSTSFGVAGTLASTNYFSAWLIGLRLNNCDARMVATHQTVQPLFNSKILWSDAVDYPSIGGQFGVSFFEKECNCYKPYIVITHGAPFDDAGYRAKIAHNNQSKIYLFAGESPEVQINDTDSREKYISEIVNQYDGLIVMTSKIGDFWKSNGVLSERIFCATSIIDSSGISSIPPSDCSFVALYFGNLVYEEVFDLIDIAKNIKNSMPDFCLDLFGDANERQREKFYEKIVENGCEKYVTLHEPVDFDTMISYQKSAKLLLFPGRSWHRSDVGFPNKLGEYLASGTPVVASDVGGINGLFVNEKELYLAEPGNNKDFAEQCIRCLADPETGKQIGQRGKTWTEENIDASKIALQFIDWVDERKHGEN